MTDDVFADWRNRRFIIVGYDLLDGPAMVVRLTDIGCWAEHANELDSWCNEYGATVAGMTVAFPNEQTLTAFALRWS